MSDDTLTDYRTVFLEKMPLLDVRAPIEFARGAFPHSHNHPLMNDEERHQVGICYKQNGQDAAIALGHNLVSGSIKTKRIAAWQQFALQHPHGALYCFRGGLRSKISQQWLHAETGIDYPRVQGGYKAMRQFLLQTLNDTIEECHFTVVGGLTGSGKTDLLSLLPHGIDLEQHANHRGSSFGKRVNNQPSQIDFEHRIAIDLLQKRARQIQNFVLEDEGLYIGRCALPLELNQRMQQLPVVWLEDNFSNRSKRILNDYVIQQSAEYIAAWGQEHGFVRYAESLKNSLFNIRKRLGSERYLQLQQSMSQALMVQRARGDIDLHLTWIEPLLKNYFDPMYSYQRKNKENRIVFTGGHTEVSAYLLEKVTFP